MRRSITGAVGLAGICAAALVTATAPAASGSTVSITPVLTGLAAPRGIAFDGQGSMYVAESGTAGAGQIGTNQTGKVSKYAWGSATPAWSTTFTSFYGAPDPSAAPDALGPEGISAVGNGCMDNSHGQRNGCQVMMIMSESTPGISHESDGSVTAPQAGHLYRLDGATGTATDKADVGSQMYAWTGAHSTLFPSDFPDSNPYAVLVTKGGPGGIRTFVADAGANTINEVMGDGSLRVVAYIPNESAPPFRDATPTCIAQGPDGYLYVGTLHLVANVIFPGTEGLSDVWRVNPNASYPAAPEKWATGLTTVSACTFDRSGNFWATEMFAGGFTAQPAPGDVVEIPFGHPDQQTHLGVGQVLMPGGIAQGPDGAMYVTTMSAVSAAPMGGVVRIG